MKHYIIVKFKEEKMIESLYQSIYNLFQNALKMDGIHGVEIKQNIIHVSNRADLMIVIDMNQDVLPKFDASYIHKEWKESYGGYIESKTIFDAES